MPGADAGPPHPLLRRADSSAARRASANPILFARIRRSRRSVSQVAASASSRRTMVPRSCAGKRGRSRSARCISSSFRPRRKRLRHRNSRSSSALLQALRSSSLGKLPRKGLKQEIRPDLQGADRLLEGHSRVRPMAITSPVAFIWVPSRGRPSENLSKGQRGNLDDHIIEGGFKAGEGLSGHRVEDLVQAIADRRSWPPPGRWDTPSPWRPGRLERLTRGFTSMT